jgi:Flp pilus assembly protein TadD
MVKPHPVARRALLFSLLLGACLDGGERHVREGNRAAQAGRLEEARSAYAAALEAHPRDVRARVLLANVLATLHDLPAARSEYTTVLAHDGDNAGARVGLARLTLGEGDASAALDLLAPLAPQPETRLLRARALIARGQAGDGAQALLELKDDRSTEATYLKGAALVLDRRFAEAQATLEGLERLSAPFARYGMARVAAAQGRAADVLLHLRATRAAQGPAWDAAAVAADPAFDFLHDSPDLQPLLAK